MAGTNVFGETREIALSMAMERLGSFERIIMLRDLATIVVEEKVDRAQREIDWDGVGITLVVGARPTSRHQRFVDTVLGPWFELGGNKVQRVQPVGLCQNVGLEVDRKKQLALNERYLKGFNIVLIAHDGTCIVSQMLRNVRFVFLAPRRDAEETLKCLFRGRAFADETFIKACVRAHSKLQPEEYLMIDTVLGKLKVWSGGRELPATSPH